jgi:hypothetical protein
MQTKRSYKIPVISSSTSSNASFANFLTEALEIQTAGMHGYRDLYWHELVHMVMYKKLENFLGPAGTTLHLFWMPAWFIEGLAEALSVSSGSDLQAGIERYRALTDTWPSFDQLHSLYNVGAFSEEGYAISGSLVTWLLRKGGPDNLPKLLEDFYRYTLPHYYPLSANPLSDFMPMRRAMHNLTKRNDRELYLDYQRSVTNHWTKNKKGPFLQEANLLAASSRIIRYDRGEEVLLPKDEDNLPLAHWAKEGIGDANVGTRFANKMVFERDGLVISAHNTSQTPGEYYQWDIEYRTGPDKPLKTLFSNRGQIKAITETTDAIYFMEETREGSKLCHFSHESMSLVSKMPVTSETPALKPMPKCVVETSLPREYIFLGTNDQKFPPISAIPTSQRSLTLATHIWLLEKTQTKLGTRDRLFVYDVRKQSLGLVDNGEGGRPLTVASTEDALWMLIAEHNRRTIRKLNFEGKCLGSVYIEDHILNIKPHQEQGLWLDLYAGVRRHQVVHMSAEKLNELLQPCHPSMPPTSPLQWAMQQTSSPKLSAAMAQAHQWRTQFTDAEYSLSESSRRDAPGLGQETNATPTASQPRRYRARPIMLLPWIGADDALGYQVGTLTIPLMDHLQNETINATLMYGIESRYPNSQIEFESTRFASTLKLTLFRHQLWNGNWQFSRFTPMETY